MNYKERQDWLKARYPLTVVTDRYGGTYSGAAYLAFPLDFDEVPEDVNGDDTECGYFWRYYDEPVGKGATVQEAIDDLIEQMKEPENELTMDYKKAYEEAFTKMQEWKKKYVDSNILSADGTIIKDLENIFPKLAESEDERVRKEMKKYLEDGARFIRMQEIKEQENEGERIRQLILGKMETSRKYSNFWSDEEVTWVEKQKKPENTSASTMIPSCWEEEQQKQKPCLICEEYDKGYKQGYTEGCTAGYNKAMKEQKVLPGFDDWTPEENLPAGFYYIDKDGNKYYSKEFRYGDMKVKVGEQQQISTMNGDADLYFDEWNQQQQNPTKRQCFEEGMRYAERLQKEQNVTPSKETILGIWELGNFWKENPEERDGLTQLQYIQKYWNEKCDYQKEQKPNIELIQRSWYMEGYHDREFGKEPKWIIKTGEGGPKHELNPRYGQHLVDEQKQEWSEDDEKILKELIQYMKDYPNLPNGHYSRADFFAWLEKLKTYAAIPDELVKIYKDFCEQGGREAMLVINAITGLNKKESPDIKPHWKPSDEQMEALDKAIPVCMGVVGRDAVAPLETLHEQLQKLM